jgi:hypothetical protein
LVDAFEKASAKLVPSIRHSETAQAYPTAEVKPAGRTVVGVFTAGTTVHPYPIARKILVAIWDGNGRGQSVMRKEDSATLDLSRGSDQSLIVGAFTSAACKVAVMVHLLRGGRVQFGFEVNTGVPMHRSASWERIRGGLWYDPATAGPESSVAWSAQ